MLYIPIITLASIGIAVSLYAYYLTYKIQNQVDYKAACDINDQMSCTKATRSPYSKTFGIPNSVLGLAYYLAIIGFVVTNQPQYLAYLVVGGLLATGYYAYLLFFKVRTICLVCVSTYIVNVLLFLFVFTSCKPF